MMGPPNLQPLGDSLYESIKRQQQKHVEYIAEVAQWHPATYFHLARIGAGLAVRGVKRAATSTAQTIDRNKKKILLLGVAHEIYSKRSTLDTNPRGRLMRPVGGTVQPTRSKVQGSMTYQIGSLLANRIGFDVSKWESRVI